MNELVFIKGERALTTSLKVAEVFEKRHDHVIRDIETILEQMASIRQSPNVGNAQLFRKTSYRAEAGGRLYPMYEMNRDGLALLAMGFTGTKALQFKLAFIEAFKAMERIVAERATPQWQTARFNIKEGFKDLAAVVKELHRYAVAHGSKASEKVFYMSFAKLLNKTLGIDAGSRDKLATWQLYEIEKLQFIARTVIAEFLACGADYHEPYRCLKSTLENYARLSFIPQRLLSAG